MRYFDLTLRCLQAYLISSGWTGIRATLTIYSDICRFAEFSETYD